MCPWDGNDVDFHCGRIFFRSAGVPMVSSRGAKTHKTSGETPALLRPAPKHLFTSDNSRPFRARGSGYKNLIPRRVVTRRVISGPRANSELS